MADWKSEFDREVAQEARNDSIKEWVKQRITEVQNKVKAQDVLRHFGVNLRFSDADHEEQFSCPFHGEDNKPSARVYPDNARSPSHVWCFVCQESWDVFKLWKKFKGEEDTRFTNILFQIEKEWGITAPDGPVRGEDGFFPAPVDTAKLDEAWDLYNLCEKRLRLSKMAFSMDGYLTIGSILDKVRFKLEENVADLPHTKTTLQQVLDKIGQKERQL